jgi:hypothetical protein
MNFWSLKQFLKFKNEKQTGLNHGLPRGGSWFDDTASGRLRTSAVGLKEDLVAQIEP